MFDSWPVGVYPTFARVIGPTVDSITFRPIDASGEEMEEVQVLFDPVIRKAYGVSIGRLSEMLGKVSRPNKQRSKRLTDIWNNWRAGQPANQVSDVVGVNFYLVTYSTKPDAAKEPIERKLIESLQLEDTAQTAH